MLSEREFNALLVQYTPYIVRQVSRRSPVDLIEDAVQDVLVDACAKRDQYDPARGAFVTWLYWLVRARMQVRATHAHKRRHLNYAVELHDDGDPLAQPVAIEGDPHARLELVEVLDAIRALKPKHAEVIMQRAIGATYEELSPIYGTSKQYIQQLHTTGMKVLCKRIGRKPQLEKSACL